MLLHRPGVNITQPENRKETRVRTALPVILENATAVTRDMSTSGVFFWIHGGACEAGSRISFAVQICRPNDRMGLICRGNIVRTERYEAMLGVAVRISESVIEPLPLRPANILRR